MSCDRTLVVPPARRRAQTVARGSKPEGKLNRLLGHGNADYRRAVAAFQENWSADLRGQNSAVGSPWDNTPDHTFIDTYVLQFRESDPPEAIACPCGALLSLPEHIMHRCPRFLQQRINTGILSVAWNPVHPSYNYTHPFSTTEGAERLLRFPQESRAASSP
ncbi:hypothetical protein H4582DRAFT_2063294 [Lactarius indigo]|nr:hypothetical protein H4582DRAFT_2063294 [Lactarius indigo]